MSSVKWKMMRGEILVKRVGRKKLLNNQSNGGTFCHTRAFIVDINCTMERQKTIHTHIGYGSLRAGEISDSYTKSVVAKHAFS